MSRKRKPHDFRQSDFGVDVLKEVGPYCKNCRRRVNWTKVTTRFEFNTHTEEVWRIRFCPKCGKMLDETNMEDMALRLEVERRETIVVSSGDQKGRATPRIIDFRNCV